MVVKDCVGEFDSIDSDYDGFIFEVEVYEYLCKIYEVNGKLMFVGLFGKLE